MAYSWKKALATVFVRPDEPSLIPGIHTVEGETQLLQVVL